MPVQEPIPAGGERWFVVHTLSHQEKRAQLQLENQTYRTFLPKRERTIRHARKLTTVVRPFFPRYLFIVLDLERHQWRAVNGTLGVAGLVMQGDRPHPVPPGIVETLLASTGPDGMLQMRPQLHVGDPVRLPKARSPNTSARSIVWTIPGGCAFCSTYWGGRSRSWSRDITWGGWRNALPVTSPAGGPPTCLAGAPGSACRAAPAM